MPAEQYIATCALCGKHEAGPWENFEGWRHRVLPQKSNIVDWRAIEICPLCDKRLSAEIAKLPEMVGFAGTTSER
jgi:hypothetical protein